MINFSFHTVDVGKDQIYSFLGIGVKGSAFGYDFPEKGVVLFHFRFLTGLARITEKEVGFFLVIGHRVFDIEDIGKLTAVIGQDQRAKIAKTETFSNQ